MFSKTITDKDWQEVARPLYESTLAATKALNDVVLTDSTDSTDSILIEAKAVALALQTLKDLPSIATAIKRLGSPTSPEACKAKRQFEHALRDYSDGLKAGIMYLKNLTQEAGKRVGSGGMAARAATGSIAFSRSFFNNIVKSGKKYLQEVDVYFNTNPQQKRGI